MRLSVLLFLSLLSPFYSLAQTDWQAMSSFGGNGRHHPITVANDEFGYVIAGQAGFAALNLDDVFRYDPSTDSWQEMEAFPGGGRGYGYGVCEGDHAYVGIDAIMKKYDTIENQIDQDDVFTIDPESCTDYDDAMSIKQLSDTTYVLKIYISNVSIWMDMLNIWENFSERISTIYLPDRKRPMLPSVLSEGLCSLKESSVRFAFMSEYLIEDNIITSVQYKNVAIRVNTNYAYDSPHLLSNLNYQMIFRVVCLLNNTKKYITNITNSHDIVAYLMILMNYSTSQELIQSKNGIYRSVALKNTEVVNIPDELPEEANKFLTIWNGASGQYVTYSEDIRHELLKLDNYVHITSPIRRLVDLLNMIIFQKNKNMLLLGVKAQEFLDNWLHKLSYINTTMRAIRKVQCDCSLLHTCMTDTSMMEKEYEGYLFDKLERNDGLFQFMVYLPSIKMASRITLRDNYDNYRSCKFRLYLFHDENKFKKKIRLNILYS